MDYIDYIASTLGVPCYLVQGNHASGAEFEEVNPFEPRRIHFMDIDNRVVVDRELFLAGLEGSIRYNRNPRLPVYAKRDVAQRSCGWRLRPCGIGYSTAGHWTSWSPTARRPASTTDPIGLTWVSTVFLWLMRTFKPCYLLHGHKHVYRHEETTVTKYHDTVVINIYPWRIIEF